MANRHYRHLDTPQAAFAAAIGDPRRLTLVVTLALVPLGWACLLVMTAAAGVTGTFAELGVGMGLLDRVAAPLGIDRIVYPMTAPSGLLATLAAVCTVDPAAWGRGDAALHFAMWLTMSLAMMLPSAAPFLRTYAEIADTAAGRRRRVPSTFILAAGYLAVWAAFALAATGLHWILGLSGAVASVTAPVGAGLAAALLAVAGLYQFSGAKASCLTKCANPFAFLFANWTDRSSGVFALGLRQGLYCLGCCWALMLTMFAAGAMNVLWMIVLTIVVGIEKLAGRRRVSQAIGVACLLASAAFAAGGIGAGV